MGWAASDDAREPAQMYCHRFTSDFNTGWKWSWHAWPIIAARARPAAAIGMAAQKRFLRLVLRLSCSSVRLAAGCKNDSKKLRKSFCDDFHVVQQRGMPAMPCCPAAFGTQRVCPIHALVGTDSAYRPTPLVGRRYSYRPKLTGR